MQQSYRDGFKRNLPRVAQLPPADFFLVLLVIQLDAKSKECLWRIPQTSVSSGSWHRREEFRVGLVKQRGTQPIQIKYLMKLYLLKWSYKTDHISDTLIRLRLFKIHFSEQFIDYYLVSVILLEGWSHSLCEFFQIALL